MGSTKKIKVTRVKIHTVAWKSYLAHTSSLFYEALDLEGVKKLTDTKRAKQVLDENPTPESLVYALVFAAAQGYHFSDETVNDAHLWIDACREAGWDHRIYAPLVYKGIKETLKKDGVKIRDEFRKFEWFQMWLNQEFDELDEIMDSRRR